MFVINNTIDHVKTLFPDLYSKSDYVLSKKISNIYPIYEFLNEISIIYTDEIKFNVAEILNNYDFSAQPNLIISKYNTAVYSKYKYDNTLIYKYEMFTYFNRKNNIIAAAKKRNSKLILELPTFFNSLDTYDIPLMISVFSNLKTNIAILLNDNPNLLNDLNNKLRQFINKLENNFSEYFSKLPSDLSIYIYNNPELYKKFFSNIKITNSFLFNSLQSYIVYLLYKIYLDNFKNIQLTNTNLLVKLANRFKVYLQNTSDEINDIMLSRYYIEDLGIQILYLYHNLNHILQGFNYALIRDLLTSTEITFDTTQYNSIIASIGDREIIVDDNLKRALFKSLLVNYFTDNYANYTKEITDVKIDQKIMFLITLKLIEYVCNDLTYNDISFNDINFQDYSVDLSENSIKTSMIVNAEKYLEFMRAFYIYNLLYRK